MALSARGCCAEQGIIGYAARRKKLSFSATMVKPDAWLRSMLEPLPVPRLPVFSRYSTCARRGRVPKPSCRPGHWTRCRSPGCLCLAVNSTCAHSDRVLSTVGQAACRSGRGARPPPASPGRGALPHDALGGCAAAARLQDCLAAQGRAAAHLAPNVRQAGGRAPDVRLIPQVHRLRRALQVAHHLHRRTC